MVVVDEESFNSDAILSHVLAGFNALESLTLWEGEDLLYTTHPGTSPLFEVGAGKNNSRVLATEFKRYRGQVRCGSHCNLERNIKKTFQKCQRYI